jgi:stearoyl-CoA desaturase (delta-9 desaturase)
MSSSAATHEAPAPRPSRRRAQKDVFEVNPSVLRKQRAVLFAFNLVPALGAIAAIVHARHFGLPNVNLVTLIAGFVIASVGFELGYHRYFTHRSFETTRAVEYALVIAGAWAGGGTLLGFVPHHRRHHQFSDREGDPHSPRRFGEGFLDRLRGLLFAHYGWFYSKQRVQPAVYARDLMQRRDLVMMDFRYYHWVALGLVLPAVIGGLATRSLQGAIGGLLWGGLTRMFLAQNAIYLVNSVCHTFGARPHDPNEGATNLGLLSLVTAGASFHHNHHVFPSSARAGLRWYQLDPSWWVVVALRALGLATRIKTASTERAPGHGERRT